MSELSSKGQGDIQPVGGTRSINHAMGVQKSGVMQKRMSPVAQRTRGPDVSPVPLWRDMKIHSLCAASVQAVRVWREHTIVPEEVAAFFPWSS